MSKARQTSAYNNLSQAVQFLSFWTQYQLRRHQPTNPNPKDFAGQKMLFISSSAKKIQAKSFPIILLFLQVYRQPLAKEEGLQKPPQYYIS